MSAQDRHMMSVMLTCRDMSATVRFYRDQLGFEMKESWPNAEQPMWANMNLGGQSVMIGAAMDPASVGEMCQGDEQQMAYFKQASEAFQKEATGVGIQVYVQVDDVDQFCATVKDRGVQVLVDPKSQFYGIRDFATNDPDGYRLVFFSPIVLSSCQSCGMPLSDAKPGEMYCAHCTTEDGQLRPYEQVFEGTVSGYFMGMQKLERAAAEVAAKEHLAKMPAWACRESLHSTT